MQKKKINVGLDIGVTSVGWSVIDENYKIIDMGVRLFDDPSNPKDGTLDNVKRRSSRSLRRMLRRTRLRKKDFISFLLKNNLVNSEKEIKEYIDNFDITKYNFIHPAQLKEKALNEKIPKNDLIFLLFHYLHHRGYFYITENDINSDDNAKKANTNKEYPSIQMINFYKKNQYFSYQNSNNEQFSNKDWCNEIEALLKKQNYDKKFINEYLEIFKRHREFNQGPGNKQSPTMYGLWRKKWNNKNHKFEITNKDDDGNVYKNLWDYTIGKCSWLPSEKRGFKKSPIAEVFNLLNDINNIYLFADHNQKLSCSDKDLIFKELSKSFLNNKSVHLSRNKIYKWHNSIVTDNDKKLHDENDVCGNRVDITKQKDIFTKLENFYILGRWVKTHCEKFINNKDDKLILNIDFIKECNNLFENLAKQQDFNERIKILNKSDDTKTAKNIDCEGIIKKLKGISATHSLSDKAMLKFIEHCVKHPNESLNQQQYKSYIFDKEFPTDNNQENNMRKYLKHGLFDNEIISPTSKRAFNQTILVFNKILKIYGKKYDFDNVVIELPRDKNTFEQQNKIKRLNKENEAKISNVLKNNGVDVLSKLSTQQKLRLKLWNDQEHKDLYSQQLIDFQDVMSGKNLHIDHIIPISISFDDSYNNKVLTTSINNSNKSNLTPYQWLSNIGEFKQFESYVNDLFRKGLISEQKRNNLLFKMNPLSVDNVYHYIGRNLADTRYASCVVLHNFQTFFQKNNYYPNAKVKVIRGAMTNFARYHLFVNKHSDKNNNQKTLIPKNRDLHCHHAIDASIVCFLGMNHKIHKLLNYWHTKTFSNYNNPLVDDETGELITNLGTIFNMQQASMFGKQLIEYNDVAIGETKDFKNKVHFSRGIISKNNIGFANETIYSYNRNNNIYYSKIDLIVPKNSDLDKYFLDERNDDLLVKKFDKQLFDKLKQIYLEYSSKKSNDVNKQAKKSINPFISYMQENYGIQNPKFILVGNQRIKKLRLAKKINSKPLLLKKHNEKAIHISLNCLNWRIYKDQSDKFKIFPINANVLKSKDCGSFVIIDKKEFDLALDNMKIVNRVSFIRINRGTILVNKNDNNDIFYICGCDLMKQAFEIKWLKAPNSKHPMWKRNGKSKQYYVPINKIIATYNIAQIDPLGRIYNMCSFEEAYKNSYKKNENNLYII